MADFIVAAQDRLSHLAGDVLEKFPDQRVPIILSVALAVLIGVVLVSTQTGPNIDHIPLLAPELSTAERKKKFASAGKAFLHQGYEQVLQHTPQMGLAVASGADLGLTVNSSRKEFFESTPVKVRNVSTSQM